MTSYRNSGPWGAGLGRRLTSLEADGNVYDHETRISDLEDNPPAAVGISNIVVTGSQVVFHLEDGTTFGPFDLPYATFNVRDDWAANTAYAAMDLVTVAGSGIYLVLQDHTSAATFDPALTSTYKLIMPLLAPAAVGTISDTAYEPGPSDAGKYFRCTSSTGCVIELTTAFNLNDEMHFRQAGTGPIAFVVGDTGGQINSVAGRDDATSRVGAVVTVKYLGSGEWDIFGDLADATA